MCAPLALREGLLFLAAPRAPPPDAIFPFPPEPHLAKERIEGASSPNRFYPDGISPIAVRLREELSRAALNSQKDKIAPEDIVF